MAGIISLLDYGGGNVRSLRNAIREIGYEIVDIASVPDIEKAQVILFPGVGSFGQAMKSLEAKGWIEALRSYILQGRPFFGICLGMQTLFQGSDESPTLEGLGIIPARITRFQNESGLTIPHIGWNGAR